MNVEIGAEAALFPEKEYINGIFVAVQSRRNELLFKTFRLSKLNASYQTFQVTKGPLCRACLHSFFIDRQSARELRITRIPRDAVI